LKVARPPSAAVMHTRTRRPRPARSPFSTERQPTSSVRSRFRRAWRRRTSSGPVFRSTRSSSCSRVSDGEGRAGQGRPGPRSLLSETACRSR
jgi:hypothetical protein